MKKYAIIMSVIAIVAAGLQTSCNKDNESSLVNIRATTEVYAPQDSKTYLDGTSIKWQDYDRIRTFHGDVDDDSYAEYQIVSGVGTTEGVFGLTMSARGWVENGPIHAIYPADLGFGGIRCLDGGGNILPVGTGSDRQIFVPQVGLPNYYYSDEGGLTRFPMYAYSQDGNLAFKNLCGVLRLHLTKSGKSIKRIMITTDSYVSGRFEISVDNGIPVLGNEVSGGGGESSISRSTSLCCNTACDISAGHDFYIALPPATYTGFQIKIIADDGSYCIKTANTDIIVERSKITNITLNAGSLNFVPAAPAEGALGGLFTINNQGVQVRFAKGNLQCIGGIYRLADHQYDCSENMTDDHFFWSAPNINFGAPASLGGNDDYGIYVDWGTVINTEQFFTPWRVLTQNEWDYIARWRPNASDKWGIARITDMTFPGTNTTMWGVVLLPDNWICPSGLTFSPSSLSQDPYGFNTTTITDYTTDEWHRMETAGAVFLPAAGGYYDSIGVKGWYWASSCPVFYGADFQCFTQTSLGYGNIAGRSGSGCYMSVRLVQDYM